MEKRGSGGKWVEKVLKAGIARDWARGLVKKDAAKSWVCDLGEGTPHKKSWR